MSKDKLRTAGSLKSASTATGSAKIPRKRQSLKSSERLRKASEFAKLKVSGYRVTLQDFIFVFGKSDLAHSRIGLVITKKIEKRANQRNLIKRRVKEVFRKNKQKLPKPFDIVAIARKNAVHCKLQVIEEQFLEAVKRLSKK